jgi:hypothetical protein
MFVGHFGVALAARPRAPRLSLGTLFIAAQWADLLWPTLVLLGLEAVRVAPGDTALTPLEFVSYPWSHSLLAVVVWGALLGALVWRRSGAGGAALVAALVVSHWVLDWITHRPDLPLVPGGAPHGLGLWNAPVAALTLEGLLFAGGAWWYAQRTAPRDATGRWGLVGLVALLVLIHLANVFGPPPPSVAAVAWAGQAQWLLVAAAYWVDRHRQPRPPAGERG